MKRSVTGVVVVATLSLASAPARAGLLGTTPFTVSCGTVINVTAANSGLTLTIDPTDPILSTSCPGGGIKVVNKGSNALNQFFTIDCGTNQAAPIMGSGIGIRLDGPNLAAFNCYVDGFTVGLEADGDGADVEDSQVQNATGDGFVVKSKLAITNINIVGVTFTGNRAVGNGGWGFNLAANEISGGTGSFFNNIAEKNAKGGFTIKGDGNALSGSEADNNGGPGFLIVSKSCCSGSVGQSFDTATAFANQGPGLVYAARNDGSNCVGGTGLTCTGGTFFPLGFDTTPGGITAAGNMAPCPTGSLPTTLGAGVCPIVLGKLCSASALNRCP